MEPTQIVEFSTSQTFWKNPTDKPVVVDIYVGTNEVPPPASPYRRGERHQAHLRIRWNAGETKSLPSMYDPAIHDVRNGIVVGGLAPQLVRTDAPDQPVADAIDVEKSKRRAALAQAEAALTAKKVAEETLVIATAQAGEAKKTIDAIEDMKDEVAAKATNGEADELGPDDVKDTPKGKKKG